MKHFISFNFGRARNKEFMTYSRRIAGVVMQYDAAIYFLSGMLKILVDFNKSMELKQVYNRKMEKTPVVLAVRSEIKRILGAILALAKALKRGNVAAQAADLAIVLSFVHKYTKSILAENEAGQVAQLNDFFLALSGDTALIAATENLQMTALFDELLENYNKLLEMLDGRSKIKTNRKEVNFNALRKIGQTAIRNLLLAIELAIIEHPEVDYSLMVAEINTQIIELKGETESRSTRKSNKLDDTITPEAA